MFYDTFSKFSIYQSIYGESIINLWQKAHIFMAETLLSDASIIQIN